MIRADARHIPLKDNSVHCVVTSPPYFGLRDYGTGVWIGGNPDCKHRVGGQVQDTKAPGAITTGQRPGVDASTCRDCGATRRDHQIGIERTPDEYVRSLVEVFREVWRVLRDDGCVWLNLGDSYMSTAPGTMGDGLHQRGIFSGVSDRRAEGSKKFRPPLSDGLKPKDLIGIPWRVAFALQADGWYLRSDIIWNKPNPMPESVEDRPTKSHEYVFLLTKRERYYYDAEAVKEPSVDPVGSAERYRSSFGGAKNVALLESDQVHTRPIGMREFAGGRNRRSVWEINTQPYKGAHFATMPERLAELCILAGTSAFGCCRSCGAPWGRVKVKTEAVRSDFKGSRFDKGKTGQRDWGERTQEGDRYVDQVVGWSPTCACGGYLVKPSAYPKPSRRKDWHMNRWMERLRARWGDPVPAVVLDPFGGSGTTVAVAKSNDRRGVALELSKDYLGLAQERAGGLAQTNLLASLGL